MRLGWFATTLQWDSRACQTEELPATRALAVPLKGDSKPTSSRASTHGQDGAPGISGMDAAATCEWYMHKARKRRGVKPASVTREETKLQECEAVLAQVLGVPVGALSRLELSNSGQEAELRRHAHDDPDVVVPLTLAFRHAVDARKHRIWWSGEAADGVHDWFRPDPQLVWRLKLMRALCGPLSHAACAQAAAAAELPAMLLEVPPPPPPPPPQPHLCTSAPLHLCTQTSAATTYLCISAIIPLHRCLHLCPHLILHL